MSANPAKLRAEFWAEGPFCRNCELMNPDCDDDIPVYFCSPACREDFTANEPLRNFLVKRARRIAREKKK